jgi:hypothetical protein
MNGITQDLPTPAGRSSALVHQTNTDTDFGIEMDAVSNHLASPTPNLQLDQQTSTQEPPGRSIPGQLSNPGQPMPQVASWVLDVCIANHKMGHDISMNHKITPTQQTPSPESQSMQMLASTLNVVAQNSIEIGNASIRTMNAVAQGLANLSGAIVSLRTDPTPTLPTCSQRSSSRPLSDVNTNTPTVKRQGHRSADLVVSISKAVLIYLNNWHQSTNSKTCLH